MEHSVTVFKKASHDLIAQANGLKTVDELWTERKAADIAWRAAELDALPSYMNGRQRKALRERLGLDSLVDACAGAKANHD